jgi:hypothetical protein
MGALYFDVNQACSPTHVVPVCRVVDLLSITHVPDRVEQYRDAMLRGELFPPICVLPLFGWFLLTDGHKRFTAYKSFGENQIVAQVWTLRRSVSHLGGQTLREAREGARIVSQLGRDPQAPVQLKKFLRSRVVHYRRLGRSLWARIKA